MDSPAIFIVDDQAPFRRAVGTVAAAAGCVVSGEAGDAESARGALAGPTRPDLVLMDINLGPDSGIDLTRELLHRDPELRVVLVSTMDAIDVPSDATTCGAVAFLEKSKLDPATLRDLVTSAPVFTADLSTTDQDAK